MAAVETIRQTTVKAASAPALAVDATAASPFAMGAKFLAGRQVEPQPDGEPDPEDAAPAAPATPTRRKGGRRALLRPRAIETLQACGPLTLEQLAEGMGIELKQATDLVYNGVNRGDFERTTDRQGNKVIQLAPALRPRGLRYLAQQAAKSVEQLAEGHPADAETTRAKGELERRLAQRAAKGERAAQATAGGEARFFVPEGFAVGLFSDGHLQINTAEQSIDLTRAQVRQLVQYLDMVASAIREGAE